MPGAKSSRHCERSEAIRSGARNIGLPRRPRPPAMTRNFPPPSCDDWIGRQEIRRDVVTKGALARFAATVGAIDGEAAPPGFHWCLCLPDAPVDALGEDGHPARGGFLPPVPLPRRMWAASEVEFVAPIVVGATVERLSTIAAIEQKDGRSGALVFVGIDHLIRADGVDAVRERQTLVYREVSPPMALPATGQADLSAWPATRTVRPEAPLLFRHSALTFNSHRIHYDLPYARDVEGYPGLVVQGPLLASLLMKLALEQTGGRRLARFAFRGVSPAFAGQPLHLAARTGGDSITLAAIGDDGRQVLNAEAWAMA